MAWSGSAFAVWRKTGGGCDESPPAASRLRLTMEEASLRDGPARGERAVRTNFPSRFRTVERPRRSARPRGPVTWRILELAFARGGSHAWRSVARAGEARRRSTSGRHDTTSSARSTSGVSFREPRGAGQLCAHSSARLRMVISLVCTLSGSALAGDSLAGEPLGRSGKIRSLGDTACLTRAMWPVFAIIVPRLGAPPLRA